MGAALSSLQGWIWSGIQYASEAFKWVWESLQSFVSKAFTVFSEVLEKTGVSLRYHRKTTWTTTGEAVSEVSYASKSRL